MDVILDGKPIDPLPGGAPTVEALLGLLRADDEDRVVVAVHLDGRPVPDAAIPDLLVRPLDGPGRLEFQTQSLRQLAVEALGQAIEALEDTRAHHMPIAEHLAAGRAEPAMDLLGRCLSAWDAADQALRHAAGLAGMPLGGEPLGTVQPDLNAPDLAAPIAACRDLLTRVQQRLQARDFVELADIVEHELPELTDRWQEMLDALRQTLRKE